MRIAHARLYRITDLRTTGCHTAHDPAGELLSDLWSPETPESDWPLPWLIALTALSASAAGEEATELFPATSGVHVDWASMTGSPGLLLALQDAPDQPVRLLTAQTPEDLWRRFWDAQAEAFQQSQPLTAILVLDVRQLPLTGSWQVCAAAAQASLFFAAGQPMLPAPWHRCVAVHQWLDLAQHQVMSVLSCDPGTSAVLVQRGLQALRIVEVSPQPLAAMLCNHWTTLDVPLGARSDFRRFLRLRLEDAALTGAALTPADIHYAMAEIWEAWS